jgi:hypothetical protein
MTGLFDEQLHQFQTAKPKPDHPEFLCCSPARPFAHPITQSNRTNQFFSIALNPVVAAETRSSSSTSSNSPEQQQRKPLLKARALSCSLTLLVSQQQQDGDPRKVGACVLS